MNDYCHAGELFVACLLPKSLFVVLEDLLRRHKREQISALDEWGAPAKED